MTNRSRQGLDELAATLGHRFARPELLREALLHPSAASRGAADRRSYERLEFLGDRVLGLIVADMLMRTFPEESEGDLARRHVALVRAEALAKVAAAIGLGRHLTLSRGEAEAGGRDSASILADSCEAVIAALYMDGGLEPAAAFVERHWRPLMAETARPPRDAKTALQEWAQGRGLALPVYTEVARTGPPHAPVFTVGVGVEGHPPATARGSSKRAAEQDAAALLLTRLAESREHG